MTARRKDEKFVKLTTELSWVTSLAIRDEESPFSLVRISHEGMEAVCTDGLAIYKTEVDEPSALIGDIVVVEGLHQVKGFQRAAPSTTFPDCDEKIEDHLSTRPVVYCIDTTERFLQLVAWLQGCATAYNCLDGLGVTPENNYAIEFENFCIGPRHLAQAFTNLPMKNIYIGITLNCCFSFSTSANTLLIEITIPSVLSRTILITNMRRAYGPHAPKDIYRLERFIGDNKLR